MRRLKTTALLALLCLPSATIHAADKKTEQAERRIAAILAEFNKELREYERELKHFERVPAFRPLADLRMQLVNQAAQMDKLDKAGRGSGPAVLELAREMDRTARQLDASTNDLEKKAETVSSKADRAVAVQMKTHADTMVKTIDQLIALFR